MTTLVPGIAMAVLGALMAALGRWGRGHAAELVPVAIPESRRVKELRTIRRGAVSCLAFGIFCLINGVVFMIVAEMGR